MLTRNTAILWRELDGEIIMLDPREGFSYNLNVVGTLVWKLLDGNHTTDNIVEAICKTYEVEYEQALQDVTSLLEDLSLHNLLIATTSRSPSSV